MKKGEEKEKRFLPLLSLSSNEEFPLANHTHQIKHQGSMKCQENRDRRKMPTNPGDMLQGHNFNQSRKL